MSTDTQWESGPDAEAVLDRFERWYHVPALLAALLYMLWIRVRPRENFLTDDTVFFSGNDAYYHYRATMYSVENWPFQLYGDPWTYFPYGGNVGNFGSLMDQAVATVALVVGLGDPSPRLVATVAVLTPPVLATLCGLLVYVLARKLTGSRIGGVTAAVVLALLPHQAWIARGTVGFYDHHIAEALMMTASVLAMVHAISTVRRERPVWEQVLDRDWTGLWPSIRASALAGLVLGLYLHTWAPGLFLIGVFGLFFAISMSVSVAFGDSPEYLAVAGVVSMAAGALTVLPWTLGFEFNSSQLSFLHALLMVSVGLGCGVLAALARYWDREAYDTQSYPLAVGGLAIVTFAVAWLLLPGFVDSLLSGLNRIVPLGTPETTLTVAEAQPMAYDNLDTLFDQFYRGYGFTFFVALAAVVWLAFRGTLAEKRRSEYLLIAIWTAFLISMAITQVRFHYYLAIGVAVLNGWFVVQVVRLVGFPSITAPGDLQTYHVLTVFVVLMLLVVPIASPLAVATAADATDNQGPGEVQLWQGNLDWLSENTPEPGQYGDADGQMDYYGPFDTIEDYDYPEGAYGVMSWWDYGHWITVEGERIPNANPFQEGPQTASAFFQETNETRANLYLDALPTGEIGPGDLYGTPTEELRDVVANRSEQEAAEETRYVMIDDQMAGGKFTAITEWTGPGYGAYVGPDDVRVTENETIQLQQYNDRFADTMLGQLYFQDAAGLEHYRLVHESDATSFVVSVAQRTSDGSYQSTRLVGVDIRTLQTDYPSVYNSITTGDGQFLPYDVRQEAAVRTYERVEGATITGETEPNATVTVSVPLPAHPSLPQSSLQGRTYAQQVNASDDGTFAVTVPYATDNQLGTEDGYTNASFRPNGTYTVFSTAGEIAEGVSVPEPAVYDGEEIDVDLEPVDTGDGNETAPGGNETDAGGNETETGGDETATGNESSKLATPGGTATDGDASTHATADRATAANAPSLPGARVAG